MASKTEILPAKKDTLALYLRLLEFIQTAQSRKSEINLKNLVIPSSEERSFEILLTFLKLFGVITQKGDGIYVNQSERTLYFLNSLKFYIENEHPFVEHTSWHIEDHEPAEQTPLIKGRDFLSTLEKIRLFTDPTTPPLERVSVVNCIIKAVVNGETKYLMQYDIVAQRYQFIGGKFNPEQVTLYDAVITKLNKEVPNLNTFTDLLSIDFLKTNVTTKSVSVVNGIITEYDFNFATCKFSEMQLPLSDIDRWVSLEEIKNHVTNDGMTIGIISDKFPSLIHLIQEVPLSVKMHQKDHKVQKSKILKNNEDKYVSHLIANGETLTTEFKSSFRWDYQLSKQNPILEDAITKTISAFLNSTGGELLVGVADDGTVLGLEQDINMLARKNEDGLVQYVINLIIHAIGTEFTGHLLISPKIVEGKIICYIKVIPSLQPVFIKKGTERYFYIRAANTSRLLNSEETFKYINLHWYNRF